MGIRNTDKREVGQRDYNKLTEATSGSPRLVVVIGGGRYNKPQKSGGKEVFIEGGSRKNGRYVS